MPSNIKQPHHTQSVEFSYDGDRNMCHVFRGGGGGGGAKLGGGPIL